MASIVAAGLASFKTSVLSWSRVREATQPSALEMNSEEIEEHDDSVAGGTDEGQAEDATEPQQVDLERLGRHAAAASQFRNMLADLKGRVARKAATRARTVPADPEVQKSATKAA
jgi:hypothetical protein